MNKKIAKSLTLLVISQNQTTIDCFNKIAKDSVKEIFFCNSAIESFDITQNQNIDIVFIDDEFSQETTTKIITVEHLSILLVNELNPDINYQENGAFCAINKNFSKEQFLTAICASLYSLDSLHEKHHNDKILAEYKKAIDAGFMVSKADLAGTITYANETFCQVSGYTQKELIGNNHNIVRHPKMAASVFKDMWQTILNKKVWRGKIANKAKDGSVYYVNSVIFPVLDEDNNIVEFLSMRQDITKIIEANQKLLKEQEEKAENAKKHYEELEKSKVSLLNIFSHELKTPLNAVLSLSQIIARRVPSIVIEQEVANTKELLEHIVENADYMQHIIDNLVDVMKLQSKLYKPYFTQHKITDILTEAINNGVQKYKDCIELNLCENSSLITLDKTLLEKIILQLISNGFKYKTNKISITYKENDGNFFLSFSDDGKGFSDPNMKISLFGQTDDSFLTRQSSGVGIGLYHAKLCAQINNWDISTANNTNNMSGATVCISGIIK